MVFLCHRVDNSSLDVLPERDSCLPGEAIAGVVMLHLTRPLTDSLLTIAFIGYEDVSAAYTDYEGDTSMTSGLHRLANQLLVLSQGPLATGDLSLPFAIPVPEGIPPTKQAEYVSEMESDGSKSRLRIKISYSLQCQLTVRDASAKSLSQEVPITVFSWPTGRPVGDPVMGEASRAFRYKFLTKKGSCHVRASLDSNVLSVGSLLSAHVWLSIAPQERLRSVDLSLVRKIVPHTKTTKNHCMMQRICTQRFDHKLLGDATEFVLRLPVSEVSAPTVRGTRRLQPFDPSETYHHFSVTYEVLVECRVRGCDTVEVHLPVTLVPERSGHAAP